jgi:hypothetical protein
MKTNHNKLIAIESQVICAAFSLSLILSGSSDIAAASPRNNNGKINNDLNLPKTGGEVQITGKQSITLQQAIDIAFRNNRDVQAARLTVDRNAAGINENHHHQRSNK